MGSPFIGMNQNFGMFQLGYATLNSITPNGVTRGYINSPNGGYVDASMFGVSSGTSGPLAYSPSLLVDRLGASPFGQVFGRYASGFNQFGSTNPYSPTNTSMTDPYNPLVYGSFGPNQLPFSPLSYSTVQNFFDTNNLNPSNRLFAPFSLGHQLQNSSFFGGNPTSLFGGQF